MKTASHVFNLRQPLVEPNQLSTNGLILEGDLGRGALNNFSFRLIQKLFLDQKLSLHY